MAQDPDEDRIRRKAFELWEAEGHPHGRDREHWEQAREMVAIEDSQGTTLLPRETGADTPVEPAIAAESHGDVPNLTDQGKDPLTDVSREPEFAEAPAPAAAPAAAAPAAVAPAAVAPAAVAPAAARVAIPAPAAPESPIASVKKAASAKTAGGRARKADAVKSTPIVGPDETAASLGKTRSKPAKKKKH